MTVSIESNHSWHPLIDGTAPAWASGWGQDAYGPFVDFEVKDIVQRLRWIPRGQFLMGSPDDEPSRDDDEGPQHWVTIPEGFWLFETPCTQELYEAVMGDNPSEFKSRKRPVEQVAWNDCQEFNEKLSDLIGFTATLPSEQEWEYACRAETTETTYAGPIEILGSNNAPILDEIAWYAGNCGVNFDLDDGYNTSSWPEKQYEFKKGGTRNVGERVPNAWGLHDMLGNVYEWCSDAPVDYDTNEVPRNKAAVRVIRGGCWLSSARFVRAAYRFWSSPGCRDNDLGFRCRVR